MEAFETLLTELANRPETWFARGDQILENIRTHI